VRFLETKRISCQQAFYFSKYMKNSGLYFVFELFKAENFRFRKEGNDKVTKNCRFWGVKLFGFMAAVTK